MPAATFTELTLPLPGTVNRMWRGNRRGRRWLDPKAAEFKETVAIEALRRGVRPIGGPVNVEIVFYIDPRRPRDIDAGVKLLLDAGNKICWTDDALIRRMLVVLADDDGIGPRTVLRYGTMAKASSYRAEVEKVFHR